jgi:hypothetical protein
MAKKKVLNFTILHDSTMMEHMTLNLKIKGSNAATSIAREKLVLDFTHNNTVVDYQTHNLKIKGLNLATGFATKKKTKKKVLWFIIGLR